MGLEEDFTKAAADVNNLKAKPTNDDLLELYGLYKQAKEGDCNTAKPGMLDLKGKAKWEAWNSRKGLAQDDAKTQYVAKVQGLITSIGTN